MHKIIYSLVKIYFCICTLVICANGKQYRSKNSKMLEDRSLLRFRRDQYANTYKVPKNHQVLLDYGWSPRQLNSFSTTSMLGMGSSQIAPTEYVYPGGSTAVSSEDDNAVAAGHSHGWGWGHGHGKDCNSALGLLGILGLASYLQMNGLGGGGAGGGGAGGGGAGGGGAGGGGAGGGGAGGGGAIGGGRLRRSLSSSLSYSQLYDSTALIVPYLLNLNHIREGDWPLDCSPYTICMLSHTVSRGINEDQKTLVRKSLRGIVEEVLIQPSVMSPELQKSELRKEVDWAITVGMTGEPCVANFKMC